MIKIRKAQFGDEVGICDAHRRSIIEVCSKDYTAEEINAWGKRPNEEQIPKWHYSIENDYCLVVEKEGAIEGVATLIVPEDISKPGLILSLYLTPDVLNRGLGGKLLGMMIGHARSKGLKEVRLDSTLTAHGFYKSKGFEELDGLITREIGGLQVRCITMFIGF